MLASHIPYSRRWCASGAALGVLRAMRHRIRRWMRWMRRHGHQIAGAVLVQCVGGRLLSINVIGRVGAAVRTVRTAGARTASTVMVLMVVGFHIDIAANVRRRVAAVVVAHLRDFCIRCRNGVNGFNSPITFSDMSAGSTPFSRLRCSSFNRSALRHFALRF